MVAIKGIIIDCLDDGPTLEKGGYIFYSGFKYGSSKTVNSSNNQNSNANNFVSTKRIKVNQFFFVRISRHDDPCIGELVSIWKDKYRDTMLASVRLYFLPEQTPDGRQSYHGQHEVLAASEPVILRLNDLVSWITEEVDWVTGLEVPYHASHFDPPAFTLPFLNLINDVKKIPTGHVNSINPHQSNHHHHHDDQHQNNNDIGIKNIDTIIEDKISKKQFTGDQQQSTSSSSEVTLTSSSSSSSHIRNNNNNSLMRVIDSQIGNQSVIVVLSYPQYCRYRAVHKKMEENMKEKENIATPINCQSNCHPNSNNTNCNDNDTKASTPLPSSSSSAAAAAAPFDESIEKKETLNASPSSCPLLVSPCFRVLFCRETFEHEGLLHHDLNCEHLAPKLKGRPRKRGANHHHTSAANNKATSSSATATTTTSSHSSSSAQDSDTSEENSKQDSSRVRLPRKSSANTKVKSSSVEVDCAFQGTINTNKHKSKPPAMSLKLAEKCLKNESEFMKQLNKFMKERNTPITRIPHLGFKKIDLFYLFTFTQKLGGYEKITQNKEWKKVYDELGGDPRSTSAATCTRRHFERLLLPFENHLAEARGLVVTRRSTRGRSISPILPAGSPVTRGSSSAAAGFDDDYQSIGSVNSTERRSHRRSHRRQGVRQSKRLKGVNSSSGGGGVSASSTVGGSNASSTATDDDECYSPMSNEDDNNVNNKEEETGGDENTSKSVELKGRSSRSLTKERSRKLSGGEEETHSVSSLSSKSREDDNGTLNKSKDIQSDSLTEEDEDNDHQEEEGEGDDTGDGGSQRKRKRRKGGKSRKVVKCKSRSPSVENNLNSSNVKKSQSERKFVVKIDGLSTGDPKIRNEDEIMSEGGEMATSQRSATSPVNLLVPKSEPIETALPSKATQDNSDSITKEKHLSDNECPASSLIKSKTTKTENESEDDSMIMSGTVDAYLKLLNISLTESDIDQCIPVNGSKLPVKNEVKPFNTKESVNYDDNESSNNNDNNIEGNDLKLSVSKTTPCNKNNNNNDKINGTNLTTGTNHCDNVNSSLSKSDSVAKITINPNENTDSHGSGTNTGANPIIDSPLSSISTLISAMDAAKQKQNKLDPIKTPTNNDNHQLSSSPTVGQTNINIVQSNVTLTSGSFGSVKKSHHVKNNANATIFQNINSRSGSSSSLSPSSGRPSVIQKTPLKPCVKVVPTYKDNPIEGLLKDNSLLKKTQLPPIAHAASFLSSSPTWFSSSSSGTPPGVSTLVNSKNSTSNRNTSSSSSSLKRKLGPSVNENSPDTFPLDLTNKKRPCDLDSRQIKSLTSKGKVPALIKLVNEGDDGTCPPAAILDLSSKIRVKESLSSKTCSSGSNTKIDNNNNNNSLHRPLSFHHQHQDANSDVNLVPVPKVPKSNINDRMKSNSSKSGNNHPQPPPPPSSRQLVNQSPLSISSPVPPGLVGILPPSSTPSSSSSSSSTPAAVVVAPTPKYHSSTSTSTNKHHHQQQAPQQNNSDRSQLVKPSPSPNALKERKESKVNHLSPVIHPGFAIKDLNQQQQLFQTHLNDVVNGISDQQHHSHHQRRQHYQSQQPSSSHHHQQQQPQQQQQLPLQLPAIPFPDNRDIQSKLQSANTLNQLRAMVTPDFALAQQTIAQEIALREMERLNPNFAKQMSQMSSAAAAAAVLGYPTGFHPMLNMPIHRSTVPTSSPSISEYNPTLPSFLPFFNSFIPPGSANGPPGVPTHSTGNGGGGVPTPNSNDNMAANAANNVNSAVAAAAAALASGHFFNPAALAAASQGTSFSPLELLGAGLVPGNERFAADDAARWRGWFESRTFE